MVVVTVPEIVVCKLKVLKTVVTTVTGTTVVSVSVVVDVTICV